MEITPQGKAVSFVSKHKTALAITGVAVAGVVAFFLLSNYFSGSNELSNQLKENSTQSSSNSTGVNESGTTNPNYQNLGASNPDTNLNPISPSSLTPSNQYGSTATAGENISISYDISNNEPISYSISSEYSPTIQETNKKTLTNISNSYKSSTSSDYSSNSDYTNYTTVNKQEQNKNQYGFNVL